MNLNAIMIAVACWDNGGVKFRMKLNRPRHHTGSAAESIFHIGQGLVNVVLERFRKSVRENGVQCHRGAS